MRTNVMVKEKLVLSEESIILKTLQDMDMRLYNDQKELNKKLDDSLGKFYVRMESMEAHFNNALANIMQQAVLRKDCDGCKKSYIRRDVALALIFGVALASKVDTSALAKLLAGG